MEHASRRLIHLNATAHPIAAWTLQQLREVIPSDHEYRFIIHDHDAIFSAELFRPKVNELGLAGQIDVFVSSADIGLAKPDPSPFLRAAADRSGRKSSGC